MRRRQFLSFLSGATTWALAARAQEPGRIYRLGVLSPNPTQSFHVEMLKELQLAGFIEGRNLLVDWQTYGQRIEQVADLAAQVVKAQPDVIFAGGDFAIRAVQKATPTIPITS
jgi:putative ABC transport system substrate-binding protein